MALHEHCRKRSCHYYLSHVSLHHATGNVLGASFKASVSVSAPYAPRYLPVSSIQLYTLLRLG
ncbi:hypothetical protein E2C01_090903 [Portunus trituberculatus]|uniref:Uncharacterized protein n=1 Tax=Portunus trituberculatus TaxID=210409 RepID=A0A5B7JCL3_PORTR|nr:hypothetical protein [Portunus trituberculatus]